MNKAVELFLFQSQLNTVPYLYIFSNYSIIIYTKNCSKIWNFNENNVMTAMYHNLKP